VIAVFPSSGIWIVSSCLESARFPSTWARLVMRKKEDQTKDGESMVYTVGVEGMSCKNCVKHAIEEIHKVSGVANVQVSLKEKSATVHGSFDKEEIKAAISGAGYKVID
jgi:copper chaperone